MISYEQLKNIDPDALTFEQKLIFQLHTVEKYILNAYIAGQNSVTLYTDANKDLICETLEDLGYHIEIGNDEGIKVIFKEQES